MSLVSRALLSGTAGSLTSAAALAVLARAEGKGAAQPLNATSHWLHGPSAARQARPDLAHTGVGYATHLAATVFWALLFEARRRPARSALTGVLPRALVVSAVAAAVDYTITPRRFTPGWELVLSKRAMAGAYVAMAAGMAVAAAKADRASHRATHRAS